MTTQHGGPRPKRSPADRRGGARTGTGPTVQRLKLDADTAAMLRILTTVRRGITGDQTLTPVSVATELIRLAYREYSGDE
jgi:hypothetical protein